jgi:hypothetical protein
MADPAAPNSPESTVRRRWPVARFLTGLALTIASLMTLVLFVVTAVVRSDGPTPRLGEVQDAHTGFVFEVDNEALDDALDDRMNHESRVLGSLGAVASCMAFVLGWWLWRPPWRQGDRGVRRAWTVIAAAGLSLAAAVPILVVVGLLYRSYLSLFE